MVRIEKDLNQKNNVRLEAIFSKKLDVAMLPFESTTKFRFSTSYDLNIHQQSYCDSATLTITCMFRYTACPIFSTYLPLFNFLLKTQATAMTIPVLILTIGTHSMECTEQSVENTSHGV